MSQQEILVLDRNWFPSDWISIKAAMTVQANNKVLEHVGEKIYMYRGGFNKAGKQSMLETSSIIIVDGMVDRKRYKEPALTNPALFQRDRFMCAYCGKVFKNIDLTRDHYMPRSKGGKDSWMNVVSACKDCNALKSDLVPGESLLKSRFTSGQSGPQGNGKFEPIYLPYVPCRAEGMLMKNRLIKADQMAFLLSRITNKKSRVFEYASERFGQQLKDYSY